MSGKRWFAFVAAAAALCLGMAPDAREHDWTGFAGINRD